jgi:HAD superfamily hydrolase (TIGR01509 family)
MAQAPRLQAVLWDVDGTLAETERDGHRVAFNLAFEARGLPWRWSVEHYGGLLRIAGGRERLLHDMAHRSDAPASAGEREALACALHASKNQIYGALVRSAGIPLRDGVLALMHECRSHGVAMAIATTTSRANVAALLRVHLGRRWGDGFGALVCGEDVQRKKPDPEVYRLALQALKIEPRRAVAIEDSPAGVASARAAGLQVIVTSSGYFADVAIEGATAAGPGLHQRSGWRPALAGDAGGGAVGLCDIEAWMAQRDSFSGCS